MYAPDQIPFNERPRGSGDTEAVANIARVLDEHGLDAPTQLYDEALALAREGHLGHARDRLRMLLCLDPDDGSAHLLLAKVFAAQKRWPMAVAELDRATSCGMRLAPGLKEAFEAARDARAKVPPPRQAAARIDSEVKALREEARRLRSDNACLERIAQQATDRTRIWTLAAAGLGLLCGGLLLALMFGGGDEAAAETVLTDAVPTAFEPAPTELPAPTALSAETLSATPMLVEAGEPTPETLSPVVEAPTTAAPPSAEAVTAEPTPSPSESEPLPGSPYVVQDGDTLGSIALRAYGKSWLWEDVAAANEALLDGGIALSVGMELEIPIID